MQAGDGPIKIGKAYNLHKRLAQGQTFSAEKLKYIGHFYGSNRIERILHHRFERYKIRGEWFEPHTSIINQAKGIYEVEYEGDEKNNYLILYRDYTNSATDICPFCFCNHNHGDGDGHRISHCSSDQGFKVIYSIDGTPLYRSAGYVVRSRFAENQKRIKSKTCNPSKKRIETHHKLIRLSISKGIENGILLPNGEFIAPKGERKTEWKEKNGALCKALFANLGFNEVGVSVLYDVNDSNWEPTTILDTSNNKKCSGWASGIYSFKRGDVNFDPKCNFLELYLSKNIIIS